MPQKAVVLFDISIPPPANHDYSEWIDDPQWESERAVFFALQKLGYEPVLLGLHDDIYQLVLELKAIQPAIVFNLAEAFKNERIYEPQIVSVLELLGIPYTGNDSLAISLCQDKNLCKKILSHHRIRVPRWIVSRSNRPLKKMSRFRFPAFVKPASEEGSEGISLDSLVSDERSCLERTQYLHQKYDGDVIIEEFIPGREFYVGVLGLKRPEILPIRELCFDEFPDDAPRFATFKAKWDDDYRKKWGIRNEFARHLSEAQVKSIRDLCKKAFEILTLTGFARFDLRVSESNEIVLIEVNPNPSIGPEDDLALAAEKAGYKFTELIEKIVQLALNRSRP